MVESGVAREVIKFGSERARGGKKRENTKGFLGSLPPLPALFLYSLCLSFSLSLFPGSCPHGWRAFVFCSFLGYNANALDLLPPVSPDSPVRSFSISLLPEDRRILCVARYTVSGVDGVYISRVFRVSYPYRFLSSRFLSRRYVAVSFPSLLHLPPLPSVRFFTIVVRACRPLLPFAIVVVDVDADADVVVVVVVVVAVAVVPSHGQGSERMSAIGHKG